MSISLNDYLNDYTTTKQKLSLIQDEKNRKIIEDFITKNRIIEKIKGIKNKEEITEKLTEIVDTKKRAIDIIYYLERFVPFIEQNFRDILLIIRNMPETIF